MRVLHVGDDFAALRPCGLTRYADALMRGQAAGGHEVTYVFSGRHYPWFDRPRLKRWRSGPVRNVELVGSPNHAHWELGTRRPERDVAEPAGEAAFRAALRDARPELVHVHELARLPSSVLDLAREAGVPVVVTLHDFKLLCASTRLLDGDGRRCLRRDVGEDCARSCAGAPDDPAHLVDWTVRFERRRLREALPLGDRLDDDRIAPLVGRVTRRLTRGADGGDREYLPPAPAGPPPAPAAFQRRRDVNVARLSACDRLVAPSARVAEVHAELGVDPSRIVVQRLALPHLERLRPAGPPRGVGAPLRFVTLGGAAHVTKGSRALLEAVRALTAAGRPFRLDVLGGVDPAVHAELAAHPAVALRGHYGPEDLPALVAGADVGIVPSVWEEAHGFVGIELLALGLPVIGSALGGIPEYVREGETGWLVPGGTGAGLADRMAHAIDRPDEVVRLAASVRARRAELVRPFADHLAEVDALYAGVLAAYEGAAFS